MSAKSNFSGKVVLITGSSSTGTGTGTGIGSTAAEEFSRAGAQVVITGRNVEKLADVGKRCLKASPKCLKALELVADVSKDDDCKQLIDSTIGKFGRLDVLVNNAGMGALSSVEDPNILEKFDKLMNSNLKSVVHLTHLSVRHLEKTKGNIINISSVSALRPRDTFGIYCMTKCALDMFTKCCALELGPKGIRVNSINPAAVRTNFGPAMGIDKELYEAMIDKKGKSYPLGRIGERIEIANAILFLASDQCSWITGISFLADGGGLNSMHPSKQN